MPPDPVPRAHRRVAWRILRRVALGLALVALVAVIGALLVIRNLDAGMVKRRLRDLAQNRAGLELDYATAKMNLLSGLTLGQLVVLSPPAFRDAAPELARVELLTLGWSLFGAGPTLERLNAHGLELTIVVDEKGRTSLDALGGGSPGPRPAFAPGRVLLDALAAIPEFERFAFDHVALNVLFTQQGKVVSRTRVDGIGGRATSKGAGTARRVELDLGRAELPLGITFAHDGAGARGEAEGTVWIAGRLEAHAAELHARVALGRQTLSPALGSGTLLALDGALQGVGDRLKIEVRKLDVLGGTVTATAALSIDPRGASIDATAGQAHLSRLAKLVPRDLLDVTCREGHLRWDAARLSFVDEPRLEPGGHVELDGRVAALRVERAGARLDLDDLRLAAKGMPAGDGGVHATVELPVSALRLARGGERVEANGLAIEARATIAPGPDHGDVKVRVASLAAGGLRASGAELGLRLSELHDEIARPRETSGQVSAALALAALSGPLGGRTIRAHEVKLAANGRLAAGRPETIDLELPISRLELLGHGDAALLPAQAVTLSARLPRIHVDAREPLRSTGAARVALVLGDEPARVRLDAQLVKQPDAVDFDLTLDAERTSLFTAFAPPSLGLPGARMALRLSSKGRLEGLAGAPRLSQKGHVHLDRPSVTLAGSALAADALDVDLESSGTPRRQRATLAIAPRALSLDDEKLGDGRLATTLELDVDRPAISLTLDGTGSALPAGHLSLAASWNRRARTVSYRVDGDLGHLAALEPVLPPALTDEHWLDLTGLRAKIAGRGELSGLLSMVDARGVPRLAPHPLVTLGGDASLALTLESVHYVDAAGVALSAPSLSVSTRVQAEGERRSARSDVRIPRASLTVSGHKLAVTDLTDAFDASLQGDPLDGAVEAHHELHLGRLDQDYERLYPIADLHVDGRVRRSADGAIHLDALTAENRGGGTRLEADGALLLPRGRPGRRAMRLFGRTGQSAVDAEPPLVGFKSLGLRARITQELDKLVGDPARLRGRGTVTVDAQVDSGDLRRFHVESSARFEGVSVELPSARVAIEGLQGLVPFVEDVSVREGKASLDPARDPNLYPALRFSDQHPFLSAPGALRADRVAVGDLALTQIAGSLRVARSRIALDQVEAEVRGGRVAGQCVVDWRDKESTVQLKLRATGVEATRARERFDANAALALDVATRSLDGRAEILRIGRHHLLDLLDDVDPHHKDAGVNRVRTALGLGWPERVRLVFDRGFATFDVAFGGLARLVRVGEVRGVPTGPLVERYLGSLFTSGTGAEAQ